MLFKLTFKKYFYLVILFDRNIYLNYDYVLKYCNFPLKNNTDNRKNSQYFIFISNLDTNVICSDKIQ